MKWDNDPNKQLKRDIFDILKIRLPKENAEKITIKQVFDAIDEMIDKLARQDDHRLHSRPSRSLPKT